MQLLRLAPTGTNRAPIINQKLFDPWEHPTGRGLPDSTTCCFACSRRLWSNWTEPSRGRGHGRWLFGRAPLARRTREARRTSRSLSAARGTGRSGPVSPPVDRGGEAYRKALARVTNETERRFLARRLAEVESSGQ